MCNDYNLMTRLCRCGKDTLNEKKNLSSFPIHSYETIIPDTNMWLLDDIVSVQSYTYKVVKVMTTGLNWTYELFTCGPRQNPSFISSMVIFEDGLKREGNQPTRTFFWPKICTNLE